LNLIFETRCFICNQQFIKFLFVAKVSFNSDVEAADALKEAFGKLRNEIGQVIVGQDETVRLLLTAIFCQGHCLLVGVPGLAKTLLIQTIASALDLDFNRIQFTPDLMPSDILGSETLDNERNFRFIKGPVFANIILADEINRTPPKTQSALLEAMQEYAVTVTGKKHNLSRPFFVLATQNPIEQEGTYPLPEAQLDRFMFMVNLDYPSYQQELDIVKNTTSDNKPTVAKVVSGEEIQYFQHLVRRVPVADNVIEYAVGLVHKTRPNSELASEQTTKYLEWGAGPRASQNLILAAKCNALINGKYSPDIEDVKAVALPILRHRIVRNFKAEAEGVSVENIVSKLL
jgi:MoxR-like ATPase